MFQSSIYQLKQPMVPAKATLTAYCIIGAQTSASATLPFAFRNASRLSCHFKDLIAIYDYSVQNEL